MRRGTHDVGRHAAAFMSVSRAMAWMRRPVIVSAIALAISSSAQASEVEHVRTVTSSLAVNVDRAVGDLLAVDSFVRIDGVVRGHVFTVDSKVILDARAVVLGSITVNRGSLVVQEGAVLPKTVHLDNAFFVGPGDVSVKPGQTLDLGDGVNVRLNRTAASTTSVALMKLILPFNRFVPDSSRRVPDLRQWHPGDGLELRRLIEGPREVTVGGIARLTFVSGKVQGTFQRGYRGERGTVLVTGVHLQDSPTAVALWEQIETAGERAKPTLSVKTALGDGAHWFFKKRNRYCMIWQKASWILAVEARLSDRQANLFEQVQFVQQVLRSLEQALSQSSAVSRGVQP